LLFVCKGNIGRSPFAAGLARRALGDGVEVASAGFLPDGRRSPTDAVAAAAAWGIDLSVHRSRVVSAALVRRSDAIFVFDADNHRRLLSDFPEAAARVHYVGALERDGRLFVEDPWGGGPDAYAASYRRIADALRAASTIPRNERA
jgi:low molecular weight protein-tyrosine phosphatase